MLSVCMILAAIAVLSCSGLPAFLFSAHSTIGQRLAALLMVLGSMLGFGGIAASFTEAAAPTLCLPWFLPWGQFVITIDIISILFLVPVFIVPMFGSIYGLKYWKQSEHPENSRRLVFFYGVLAGSMAAGCCCTRCGSLSDSMGNYGDGGVLCGNGRR